MIGLGAGVRCTLLRDPRYVNTIQYHIDRKFPADDQIGELAALQQEGKIRYIGLSEVTVGDLENAQRVPKIVSVQNM